MSGINIGAENKKSLQPVLPGKSSVENAIHPWASSLMLYQLPEMVEFQALCLIVFLIFY
jgi:hypothetical protein